MVGTIDIHLDTNLYKAPTQQDVKDAKRFVLMRNENSATLSDLIEELISDAAREITLVCYKYNIRPQEFQFTANETMKREVYGILDKLEAEIYDLVLSYSLNVTKNKERRQMLLPFLLTLKSKDTTNLQDTLHARMMQFRYDLEAQIAAMMLAKLPHATAVSRVLSTLHSVYSSPEMLAAFKRRSAARNVKAKGVHTGGQGLSNSGAVNIENFARQTAILTWSKNKYYDYRDMAGIAGYYTLRGSSYDCALCDSKVGFHSIFDADGYPPFHGHCCCYAIPIVMRNDFT